MTPKCYITTTAGLFEIDWATGSWCMSLKRTRPRTAWTQQVNHPASIYVDEIEKQQPLAIEAFKQNTIVKVHWDSKPVFVLNGKEKVDKLQILVSMFGVGWRNRCQYSKPTRRDWPSCGRSWAQCNTRLGPGRLRPGHVFLHNTGRLWGTCGHSWVVNSLSTNYDIKRISLAKHKLYCNLKLHSHHLCQERYWSYCLISYIIIIALADENKGLKINLFMHTLL